jgi:hypothetical protein
MIQLKSSFLILSALFILINLEAQSGPVTTGYDATGSGGSVSYSIGQIDYTAPTGSGGSVHEGLQQPYEFYTFGVENNPSISLELMVYPNPTTSTLFLNILQPDLSNLNYQLYDELGRELASSLITEKTTPILMESYSPGIYLLKIFDTKNPLQTFKIIKK